MAEIKTTIQDIPKRITRYGKYFYLVPTNGNIYSRNKYTSQREAEKLDRANLQNHGEQTKTIVVPVHLTNIFTPPGRRDYAHVYCGYSRVIQNPAWYNKMDKLTKKRTGWNSFKHMCRGKPTLRLDHSQPISTQYNKDMAELRRAYEIETGKSAFQ